MQQNMEYTQEMVLVSDSGYCMPFREQEGRDVEMTLGYGTQTHPQTGKDFFHEGVDFDAPGYMLYAVASGKVTGLGTDESHGTYLTVSYGRYDVRYAHLYNVLTTMSRRVRAGQPVAVSGRVLHMEVRFDGQRLNPLEFLTMLYANLRSTQAGPDGMEFVTMDMDVPTDYEKDREEIERLLERYFASYMDDLRRGLYLVPERTEWSLRNMFTVAAERQCLFEQLPSMANPLGIGAKAVPVASKVQNLLIADFLNYLELRHGVYLSTLTEEEKKKNSHGS